MTFGLESVTALARVCYHAQELSLLTASSRVDEREIVAVKRALDQAWNEMFNEERHEPN